MMLATVGCIESRQSKNKNTGDMADLSQLSDGQISAGSESSMVIGRPLAAPIHRASREDQRFLSWLRSVVVKMLQRVKLESR
jgi:hypothetical protein